MGVLAFVVALVVLIIGHEFGHFLVAKWVGMRVPEFGIGFPPKLWGFTRGETEYTINALPIGGFVRIVGEDGGEEHPDAFGTKTKWAQAGVLVAGPCANIVLGFIALFAAFMIGVPTALDATESAPDERVVVTQVLPHSPAASAGVRVGDTLIGFTPTEEPLALHVVRSGEELTFNLVPESGVIPEDPSRKAIGIGSVRVGTVSDSVAGAFVHALTATYTRLVGILTGFGSLIVGAFTFSSSIQDLSGPVGIAAMAGDAAAFGTGYILSFIAIISLNLAVLNLLPFPALDGGRLLFLIIEVVRGRAVQPSTAALVNNVGFSLLLILMLVVTWNDIAKLIT